MKIAVGTSSTMVAATAIMGFAGHATGGHFKPEWAVPLACFAIIGGLIGGKFTLLMPGFKVPEAHCELMEPPIFINFDTGCLNC